MKRTAYIAICPDAGETAENQFNKQFPNLRPDIPSLPYIEVELKVIYHEPKFISQRSKFADKLGASIIIPKGFTQGK